MESALVNRRTLPIKKSKPILVLPRRDTAHYGGDGNSAGGFYILSNLDQTVYCFKPNRKKSTATVVRVIRQALTDILDRFVGKLNDEL
ncbi:hypothetical protein U1Q18_001255 [Sarracenia purpurea var. burkii]